MASTLITSLETMDHSLPQEDPLFPGLSARNRELFGDCPLYKKCAQCNIEPTKDNGIKLSRCSACRLVSYCSKECQLKHWPKHKEICGKCTQEMKRMKTMRSVVPIQQDEKPLAQLRF